MSPLATYIASLVADGYKVTIYAKEGEADVFVTRPDGSVYTKYLGEFGGNTDELIQSGASIFYLGE